MVRWPDLRILMLTWEYPPYKTGGIAEHSQHLAETLAGQGHDPVVLSYGQDPSLEFRNGVEVHRVDCQQVESTISWSMRLGHKMERKAIELDKKDSFDIVHGHDWMMVPAATGTKNILDVPMVFTIHSTTKGRDGTLEGEYQATKHNLEWYGTYKADQVITVGKEFSEEVRREFEVPETKINYIPNGVKIEKFERKSDSFDKSNYALDWENIVLFVGRMYPQKGPGHLIDAIPDIIDQNPEAKFVMCGEGATEHYKQKAKSEAGEKVHFPGYVSEKELVSLMKTAKINVTPSVYEPFGIVPLEAAACKTPTVGSYTGGMKDTIIHEYTGLHSYPADSNSIKNQVTRALEDPNWTDWMGEKARERVEDNFRWEQIAGWTTGIYRKALGK
jgi:glycosyltransferase involved in cell wall biosynthesis